MKYFKISIGIFIALAASRFVPHPPNFTSLLALSFYVPVFLGIRFIPALVVCFIISDYFIGFHLVTPFTWGSVILIGLVSKYFNKNTVNRIIGALSACLIFFIITNFGVWSLGSYGYNFEGLLLCYTLAIPFFANNVVSTLIFALVIEVVYKLYNSKLYKIF